MIRITESLVRAAQGIVNEVGVQAVRVAACADLDQLQLFQKQVLSEGKAADYVVPKTLAERQLIAEEGGLHLAAYDETNQIVGILSCCYALELESYEKRLCYTQMAGRSAMTSKPVMVLAGGMVSRWLHGRNVMTELLLGAEAHAKQIGCGTLSFIATYTNLPMLRAGFGAEYRIIGCGRHSHVHKNAYLYERRLLDAPPLIGAPLQLALERDTVEQITLENMLDDDYAIIDANFSQRKLTLQKWAFEQQATEVA